jgi:hypothetical protein
MPVEKFEQHLKCDLAPASIDPEQLVFRSDEIENYAVRLYGNSMGTPGIVTANGCSPVRPRFMSGDFFRQCNRLQEGVESLAWPDSAVMFTVSLVSPKIADIEGFNSAMLSRVTNTHVNILFDILQEQKNGRYPYRKRKIVSPAVVVPERISKKENGKPRHVVSLHYHAVIGFQTHDQALEFEESKGEKIMFKTYSALKTGLPDNAKVPPEYHRFDDMDCDVTVSEPGHGSKLFGYACKYVYELLGHTRVCTPDNASKV